MRNYRAFQFLVSGLAAVLLAACGGGATFGNASLTGGGTGGTPTGVAALLSVTSAQTQITADGVSTAVVTATLTDTAGQALGGKTLNFTTNAGTLSTTGAAPFAATATGTTDAQGKLVVFLRSTTTQRQATVTATEAGTGVSGSLSILFAAGAATGITLTATPTTVAPNQLTSITVKVTDANGNPVGDRAIILKSTAGTGSYDSGTSATSDASGTVTTTFAPSASTSLSATLVTENITSAAVAITVDPTAAVVGTLTVTALVGSVNADGISTAVVRANVQDAGGTVIPGFPVSFTTLGGAPTPSSGTVNTLSNGNADFSMTAISPGTVTVKASTGGVSRSVNVTFVGSAAVNTISMLASSPQLQSGATTQAQGVTITALLKDAGNNVVTGAPVSFTSAKSGASLCGAGGSLVVTNATSAADGTATAVLSTGGDPQNQTITVTATAGGKSSTINISVTGTVLTIAGADTLGLGAISNYTVSLRDSSGRGISNQAVSLTTNATVGNGLSTASVTTDANGQATFNYTATNGGADTIGASTASSCNTASKTVVVSNQALQFVVPPTSAAQVATTVAFSIAAVGANQAVNVGSIANSNLFLAGDKIRVIRPGSAEITGTVQSIAGTILTVTTTAIVSGAAGGGMATPATVTKLNNEVVIGTTPNAFEINAISQTVKVQLSGGIVNGQAITFTSSRGTLSPPTATDANGVATVVISQAAETGGTGGGVLTATGPGGITATLNFTIVSHNPVTISLQATPNNVPINTGTSAIRATVRDSANNPVKDAVVLFTLTDTSGGGLSASSAATDSSGAATVTYTAGGTSSAKDGVSVRAALQAGTMANATATLTVGGVALRIVLGTGNTITAASSTIYSLPYSVLVTDSGGNPLPNNTSVSLLIQPLAYEKGGLVCGADGITPPWTVGFSNGMGGFTLGYAAHANSSVIPSAFISPPALFFVGATMDGCRNEDTNFNGILDPIGLDLANSEDNPANNGNGNGILTPGNVASVPTSVTLDANGLGNFNVLYPKDRAYWVQVRLTAIASVQGSEKTEVQDFILPGLAADYSVCLVSPPGQTSPYGTSNDCTNPQ